MDSFGEGFDPDDFEEEMLSGATLTAGKEAFRYNSFDYVRKKVKKLGLEDRIVLVKGLFSSTLPQIKGSFSLVVIDCDLGKTIEFCLREMFPKLSPGAIIVIDDYNNPSWTGVTPVVDDFMRSHQARAEHGLQRMPLCHSESHITNVKAELHEHLAF